TQRLLLAASIPTATELPEEVYHELLFSERPRTAHVLSLEVRDEARGVLLSAGPGNLSGSQRAALQSLATSVSLALEGAALTEDLDRRESEARFSSLVARSSDLITVIAADGTVLYQSPSIERVLGYAADEVIGTRFDDLMDDHERGRLLAVLSSKNKQPASGPEAIDCRLRHRDGRWLQFEVLHTNLLDDEHVRGIVLNSRDVSERKAFEEQLAHQAFHDSLTMLANRALFADRVEHALARAGSQGTGIAVVFGDLDDFKTINDSLGHGAGDEVLVEVARRLAATVRPEDTAARFGGDEFAVLLEGIVTDDDATEGAERVLEAFRRPIQLADAEVFVRTSIGIAITRDGVESTPSELLRNADVAMYIAKRDGKGGYRVFEESMHAEALERLELRADLQRAIDSDQFALVYQPVVRLDDMTVSGVEALLRWRHPTRGVIAPAQFIPAAEDMGLIVPIGQWVLREAFAQAVHLQTRFPSDPQLTMAGNLSPRQLNPGDSGGEVRRARRERDRRRAAPRDTRQRHRPVHGRARDHGEPDDDRRRPRHQAARGDEGPRRAAGDGRLRHGLVVAQLPEPFPGRHPEDGPLVPGGRVGRRQRPGGRRGGAGRDARHAGRRRRHRAPHPDRGVPPRRRRARTG